MIMIWIWLMECFNLGILKPKDKINGKVLEMTKGK